MNRMNFSRKLVDPTPAGVRRVFHPFWGFVTKPAVQYGPDAYGAYYKQLSYDYEPVKGRTVISLQPVVVDPTVKRS